MTEQARVTMGATVIQWRAELDRYVLECEGCHWSATYPGPERADQEMWAHIRESHRNALRIAARP